MKFGRRIRKKFGRKWHSGIIASWDENDKLCHAKYDDVDSEDLDLDEMHECLIHMSAHIVKVRTIYVSARPS